MRDDGQGYYSPDACELTDFAEIVGQSWGPEDAPHATSVEKKVPVYEAGGLDAMLTAGDGRRQVMAEWAAVLLSGPGVLVLRGAQPDHEAIEAASRIYETIIADEKTRAGSGADHFAAAGSNDRIWNSLQKLCAADPEVFVRYFAAPAIDAVCEAWLGPGYQMTAQINLVHPGGAAQQAHRDYHLGFQTAEVSAAYPAHVHDLSPLMTLQGGIAHGDAPVEAGPTKLLPFSQSYRPGYAAWRRGDFRAFFEDNCVQLPLAKGDALFFSPALFHAAGENRSVDNHRMVNLLQVSSPFGRSMESVDRDLMCRRAFDALKAFHKRPDTSEAQLDAAIAAIAEGYSFPTNLDRDPPVGGLAPVTQAAVLRQAVTEDWDAGKLTSTLDAMAARRRP